VSVLLAACATLCSPAALGQGSRLPDVPLGIHVASADEVCRWQGRPGDEPLPIMLGLDPAALHEPHLLGPVLACAAERNLTVAIRLVPPPGWTDHPEPSEALAPWLADVERLARLFHAEIRVWQAADPLEVTLNAEAQRFLAESLATRLRAIDQDALVVGASLAGSLEPQIEAWPAQRVGPYLTGIALEGLDGIATRLEQAGKAWPGMPLWVTAPMPASSEEALAALSMVRRAGGRTLFLAAGLDEAAAAVALNLVLALPTRFVVDKEAHPSVPGATVLSSWLDPLGPERALLVSPEPWQLPAAGFRASLGPDPVQRPLAFDLSTGRQLAARADGAVVAVEGAEGPVLLRYIVAAAPRPAAETIGVTGERGLTIEEIIARHRAAETSQSRAVEQYTARAVVSYHYRAESINEAVDVRSENRFFWRGGVGEYEETGLYVNGARWRGTPPALPFIQPEKVKEVPLEIRLDQSYSYQLEKEEEVNGRDCYVVSFKPSDPNASAYSGEVWIDKERFVRIRIRLVQHNLKVPITSSTDRIDYAAVPAPEGEVWLPSEGYRQMVFTVLGRAVAVERRVAWEGIHLNAAAFDEERAMAYASGRPIMRDDEEGTSYLVTRSDGVRTVQNSSLRNVALVTGFGVSAEGNASAPFAAINYFDFDYRGTGTQLDWAFAGALLSVDWTDPKLGSSPWELTVEGRFVGLQEKFHSTTIDGKQEERELRVLEQQGFIGLARPVTAFSKFEFPVGFLHHNYDRTDETNPDFVLPQTGMTLLPTARWKYQRNGYLGEVWAQAGHRFGWEDWGLAGVEVGTADQADFQRWGAGISKAFYPGVSHKVSLGGNMLGGHELDRFSRFRVGDFRNVRVRGYNSADITFDRGVTGQVSWQASLPAGGVAIETGAEAAVIENEDAFSTRQVLYGGGLGVSFQAFWGMLGQARIGWGFDTSLDLTSSSPSLRVTFIKTWDNWPWRNSAAAGGEPENPPMSPLGQGKEEGESEP